VNRKPQPEEVSETTYDPIAKAAEQYAAAFPEADAAAIEAHLLLVFGGSQARQAMGRYLLKEGLGPRSSRYSFFRLLYLSGEQMLPQHVIARDLDLTAPSVTEMLDGLEREGLVERITYADNRRTSFVRLTDMGMELSKKLISKVVERMELEMSGFSSEEKAMLVSLLARYRRTLRQLAADETSGTSY
jgi:DNA-binding MarR family transcriptional regulator